MAGTIETDICVIGGGSGGLTVAAGASQMGARTVLIEKGKMGGDCLNSGCVPSKALIAAGHADAIFSPPVEKGEYKVITVAEARVAMGYGFGGGGGVERRQDRQPPGVATQEVDHAERRHAAAAVRLHQEGDPVLGTSRLEDGHPPTPARHWLDPPLRSR